MIDGVRVQPLRRIADERGAIMHMMRRDDPWFEQRLRRQIYGTTAAMARTMDAAAAAEPALRRSLREVEAEIAGAVAAARAPLPPGDADDDRGRDFDDEGPEGEPYRN